MTKKDYIAFARLLATFPKATIDKDSLVLGLAAIFEADNPNFDYCHFEKACYQDLS